MWANLLMVVLFQIVPTLPPLPSPTPFPTATIEATAVLDIPRSEIYNFLSTAVANVNALPDDINAPGGVGITPNEDGSTIFGYAKWMFGFPAKELLGTTISPIATHVWVLVVLIVILTTIYLAVNLVTTLIKGVTWIIQQVLRLIPFIGAAAPFYVQAPPTPTAMPAITLPGLDVPTYSLWTFTDDTIAQWNRFSPVNQVFQVIVIVMLVIVGVLFIVRRVRSFSTTSDRSEE
jgi:hypothetical protein